MIYYLVGLITFLMGFFTAALFAAGKRADLERELYHLNDILEENYRRAVEGFN